MVRCQQQHRQYAQSPNVTVMGHRIFIAPCLRALIHMCFFNPMAP
jgi:hypothetical protein